MPPTKQKRKRLTSRQKVLKVFPNATSVYFDSQWHIYSGDSETGNTCIGSAYTARLAWEDAELNNCHDIGSEVKRG